MAFAVVRNQDFSFFEIFLEILIILIRGSGKFSTDLGHFPRRVPESDLKSVETLPNPLIKMMKISRNTVTIRLIRTLA